jgi:hypothetical protein
VAEPLGSCAASSCSLPLLLLLSASVSATFSASLYFPSYFSLPFQSPFLPLASVLRWPWLLEVVGCSGRSLFLAGLLTLQTNFQQADIAGGEDAA